MLEHGVAGNSTLGNSKPKQESCLRPGAAVLACFMAALGCVDCSSASHLVAEDSAATSPESQSSPSPVHGAQSEDTEPMSGPDSGECPSHPQNLALDQTDSLENGARLSCHEPETRELCSACEDAAVRESCVASCAEVCFDPAFYLSHPDFCVPSVSGELPDANTLDCPLPAPNRSLPTNACEQLRDDAYAYRQCQALETAPHCVSGLPQFREYSEALLEEIDCNLAPLTEFLWEVDFTGLDSLENLCRLTPEWFNQGHAVFASAPMLIEELRSECIIALDCALTWKAYLEDRLRSGEIVDHLRRAWHAELGVLEEAGIRLAETRLALESAESYLDFWLDLHVTHCTPAQ